MAQVKISELPSASSLTGSEVLPIVQGGSTLGATVNQIKDKIQASTINVLKMNASSVQTLANIGELAFNPDTQTLEVKCSADVTLSIGQENYIRGKNAESSTILNGTVVYVSGGLGANSLIKRAGNADGTAERVIGVATQDIGANNIGFITTSGIVNKLNTSAYLEGDLLWLGTNGAMTNVKPNTSVDQICIGVVLRSHATEGSILVAVKDDWRDKLAEVRSDLSKTTSNFADWYAFHVESKELRDSVKSIIVTGADTGYVYYIANIYRNHPTVNEQIVIYKRKLSDGTETLILYNTNVESTGIQEVKCELAGRNEVFYVTIYFDKIPDGGKVGNNETKMVINPECYSYREYTVDVADKIAKLYSVNWPYLSGVIPNTHPTSLTLKQMQDFFLDLNIIGTYDQSKNYSIGLVRRNYEGHWILYLHADSAIVSVFDVTSNPEEGDKVTIHTLSAYNNSGITAKIAVNWSKILNGTYSGMLLSANFTLDPRCWDVKNCPIIYPYEINLVSQGFSSQIINLQNSIVDFTRKIPTKTIITNTTLTNGAIKVDGGVKVPAGQTGYDTFFNAPFQCNQDKIFAEYSGKYLIATYIYLLSGSEIAKFDSYIYGGGIVGGGRATSEGKVIDATNKILYVTYPKFLADPTITANQYLQLKGNTPVANDFTITLLGAYIVEENSAAKNQKQIAVGTELYRTQKQILYELQHGEGAAMITNLINSLAVVKYNDITVKRYGVSGVDADFCGLNAIGDALASITDASELNRYKIRVEGTFHFTNPLDVIYREPLYDEPTIIVGKDWVDIEGIGQDKTVIAMEFTPQSVFHSGKVYTDYQPVMWNCNSKLSNMSIVGKYCRYAVHFEGGNVVKDKTLNFENLYILGKDNLNTVGTGMRDGQVWNFKQCRIISDTGSAFGVHSPLSNVDRSGEINFHECSFFGNIFFNAYPNNKGIDVNFINCTHEKKPQLSYNLYYTNRAISADYSNIKIRSTRTPILFNNTSNKGAGLRIKSSTTGVNSVVAFDTTCSAFDIIIGDSTKTVEEKTNWLNKKRWGYEYKNGGVGLSGYAIGHIDIDELNTAKTNGLGVLLGDCSVINKELKLSIDGVNFSVIFNEDYTSKNNDYVIALINSVIGGAGVADVYNISKSYYPDFSGMKNQINADTTAILAGMGVIFINDSMRIATNSDNRIDGICLYDTAIGEVGRCITSGYIYPAISSNRVKTREVNSFGRPTGTELGISVSNPGVFDPAATPKLLRAINDNELLII